MCLIFPQGVRDYILGQQSDAMDEMVLRVRRLYQFFDRRLNHRSIVFVPVALTSAFSLSLSLPHSHAHTHTHARAATYATATATAPARRYDERRDAQDCARTDHHVRRSSVGPRLRYLPAQRTRAWIAPSSFCFVLFPPFLLFCFVLSFSVCVSLLPPILPARVASVVRPFPCAALTRPLLPLSPFRAPPLVDVLAFVPEPRSPRAERRRFATRSSFAFTSSFSSLLGASWPSATCSRPSRSSAASTKRCASYSVSSVVFLSAMLTARPLPRPRSFFLFSLSRLTIVSQVRHTLLVRVCSDAHPLPPAHCASGASGPSADRERLGRRVAVRRCAAHERNAPRPGARAGRQDA